MNSEVKSTERDRKALVTHVNAELIGPKAAKQWADAIDRMAGTIVEHEAEYRPTVEALKRFVENDATCPVEAKCVAAVVGSALAARLSGTACQHIAKGIEHDAEFVEAVAEGLERGWQDPWKRPAQPKSATAPAKIKLTSFDDVEVKEVEWLVPGLMPRGELVLLAGDGGQGKSQITCYIAAQLSHGRAVDFLKVRNMHTSGKAAGATLFINSEDDIGKTLKPRLLAAGAHMSNVFTLPTAVERDLDGYPKNSIEALDRDSAVLDRMLDENPEIRLVVIDPITSYMGKADNNSNGDVRRVLDVLNPLAHKHNVTMLAVSHLNKGTNAENARHRISGSGAFVNAARSVLIVAPEKDAELDESGNPVEFVMVHVKSNYSKLARSQKYSIEEATVKTAGGREITTPRVRWRGVSETTHKDMTGGNSGGGSGADFAGKVELAKVWLADKLKRGPREAGYVRDEATRAGISRRALDAAKRELGVEAGREDFGGSGRWGLPGDAQPTRNQSRHH